MIIQVQIRFARVVPTRIKDWESGLKTSEKPYQRRWCLREVLKKELGFTWQKEGSENLRPREKHLPNYGGERPCRPGTAACCSMWQVRAGERAGGEARVGRQELGQGFILKMLRGPLNGFGQRHLGKLMTFIWRKGWSRRDLEARRYSW